MFFSCFSYPVLTHDGQNDHHLAAATSPSAQNRSQSIPLESTNSGLLRKTLNEHITAFVVPKGFPGVVFLHPRLLLRRCACFSWGPFGKTYTSVRGTQICPCSKVGMHVPCLWGTLPNMEAFPKRSKSFQGGQGLCTKPLVGAYPPGIGTKLGSPLTSQSPVSI